MLTQFKYVVKYALELDRAGRNFAVFPDDTFLVSYPKSGNTWVRFLLANLLYSKEAVGFANINRLIPDPAISSKRFLKRAHRPRILKTHEPFDVRFQKVVYIVRDPRDVAVSEYYFDLKKRYIGTDVSLKDFVPRFIEGKTGGYGSWWEHAAGWIAARHFNPGFFLIRYEDLLADALGSMEKLAEFLGIHTTSQLLEAAIGRSSADRMRTLEKRQADQWTGTKNTRQNIPFVRTARSGDWKTALPSRSVEELENAWAPLMNFLGYELQSRQLDKPAMWFGCESPYLVRMTSQK